MIFPIQIDQHSRKPQVITWALILINAIVFWWQLQIPIENIRATDLELLVVPVKIVANPLSLESFFDIMRSTFMHASYGHIIGNMLFLHLFGTNVERKIGSWLFLFLYILSGITSALLHVVVFSNSHVPLLGASGAIAGMMGVFLILFPRAKIRGLFPLGVLLYPFLAPFMGETAPLLFFVILPMEWSAWIFLGIILFRDLSGAQASLAYASMGGVAHFGHLGGFAAGLFFGLMVRLAILTRPRRKRHIKGRGESNIYSRY